MGESIDTVSIRYGTGDTKRYWYGIALGIDTSGIVYKPARTHVLAISQMLRLTMGGLKCYLGYYYTPGEFFQR